MARAKRPTTRRARRTADTPVRFTIDASVFVNAFNPHEAGHAASLAFLSRVHEQDAPVILPALVLPEIASAIARATGQQEIAIEYALAVTELAEVSIVSLTQMSAADAAQLAAAHRLRGADAVYAAIARRYATTLVTRDTQQRLLASAVVPCLAPEEALGRRG